MKTITKSARNILIGTSLALLLFGICVFIRPEGLSVNEGLSYFGVYKNTVVFFSLAIIINSVFYLKSARSLSYEHPEHKYLAKVLRIMAIFLLGLMMVPYSFSNPIHTAFGAGFFFIQFAFSAWLIFKIAPSLLNYLLVSAEILSGVAAFYFMLSQDGFLLQSQILFQVFFVLLFVKVLNLKF